MGKRNREQSKAKRQKDKAVRALLRASRERIERWRATYNLDEQAELKVLVEAQRWCFEHPGETVDMNAITERVLDEQGDALARP